MLDRIPETVQGPDSWIASPRKYELGGTPGANQLVVNEVRCHPHQREVLPLLPYHFVRGGEWNQVGKSLHGDGVAVTNRIRNRIVQTAKD